MRRLVLCLVFVLLGGQAFAGTLIYGRVAGHGKFHFTYKGRTLTQAEFDRLCRANRARHDTLVIRPKGKMTADERFQLILTQTQCLGSKKTEPAAKAEKKTKPASTRKHARRRH